MRGLRDDPQERGLELWQVLGGIKLLGHLPNLQGCRHIQRTQYLDDQFCREYIFIDESKLMIIYSVLQNVFISMYHIRLHPQQQDWG